MFNELPVIFTDGRTTTDEQKLQNYKALPGFVKGETGRSQGVWSPGLTAPGCPGSATACPGCCGRLGQPAE